jgi:hypothetical protein
MLEDQFRLFCPVTERFIVVSKIDAESKFRECTDSDVLVVVYDYLAARHEGKIPKPKLAATDRTADDGPNDDVPAKRLNAAVARIQCPSNDLTSPPIALIANVDTKPPGSRQ